MTSIVQYTKARQGVMKNSAGKTESILLLNISIYIVNFYFMKSCNSWTQIDIFKVNCLFYGCKCLFKAEHL